MKDIMSNLQQNNSEKILLSWVRQCTRSYPEVNVLNFTTSWSDGLAFNGILHHFRWAEMSQTPSSWLIKPLFFLGFVCNILCIWGGFYLHLGRVPFDSDFKSHPQTVKSPTAAVKKKKKKSSMKERSCGCREVWVFVHMCTLLVLFCLGVLCHCLLTLCECARLHCWAWKKRRGGKGCTPPPCLFYITPCLY